MRAAAIALVVMVVLGARPAAADAVDDAIQELRSSANVKDRMSAGVELVASGDPRAIAALAHALLNDRNKTVRSIAAAGLGAVVSAATSATDQQIALTALRKASKQDKDAKVKRRAKKAYAKLMQLAAAGGTYIDIGSIVAGGNASVASHLRQTIDQLVANQPGLQTTSPGAGFHLETTVVQIAQLQTSGASTKVQCKVEVALADYPAKVTLAWLVGSATTVASPTATTDCLDTALTNLLTTKGFPRIAKLAPQAAVTQSASTNTASSSSAPPSNP